MPALGYLYHTMVKPPLILVLAISLAALSCTESNDKNGNPEKTEALAFTGQKVTLMADLSHTVAAKALAKWFHSETGAAVETKIVHYRELGKSILADNAAAAPQVDVYMSWYVDLGKLVYKGALVDLTEFIEHNKKLIQPEDFLPSVYDAHTKYRGRRWALPFDGDTHVLFYRKSLLAKYNLSPPVTWEDYLNVAKVITRNERSNGIYGCAIMAHPTPILIISCFMNRLGSYGGTLLDADGSPSINSIEAQAALQDMLDQSVYALPKPTKTDFVVARDAFLTGQVAMVEHWTDIGIMAEDPEQSLIKGDWGVVQMPMGKGPKAQHAPALNAGFVLGLSTKAPHPEVAKGFILFATRKDILLKLNLINGGVDPSRISILDSQEFKKFAPALREAELGAIQVATPWPVVPRMDQLLEVLSENIAAALDHRKTPKAALNDTQHQWLKIIQ